MYSRKQLSTFFALFVLGALWVLYGWNFWNGDREGYEAYYLRDSLAGWGGEIGYGYLNLWANQAGLSYQEFQVFVALGTLLLLFRYMVKMTLSPFTALIVYAICFFALDYVLVRNFLAFAVLLQAFIILFEDRSFSRIKYVALVLLATSIHQSSFVFLVYVIMPTRRVVPLGRFFILLFGFFATYVILRASVPLPESMAAHFDYYGTVLKSSLANVAVHVGSVIAMLLVVMFERKSVFRIFSDAERDRVLFFIVNVNLFSLFFLILYFESEIFVRLLRIIMFFNIMHCISSLFLRRKTYFFLLSYIFVFGGYLVLFFLVPTAKLSVVPLFRNNLLLN